MSDLMFAVLIVFAAYGVAELVWNLRRRKRK